MKRLLAWLALGLGALAVVVVLRAALLRSRQLEVPPAPPVAVDADAVARHLGQAVAIRTVSHQQKERGDPAAFRRLHRLLATLYPRVHRSLRRETVDGLSLLYTWRGRDDSLAPVLLAAHQDVVPVDPATRDEWTHPAFSGAVADGSVWGRGALDDKGSLIALLEAVEGLLAQGFVPERSVYLAFGHDEEVSGFEGAGEISKLLASRGVTLDWVLDEGGLVADGMVPGIQQPIAVVGIAEKGSVSIALEIEAPGGHSSTPPPHSAIGDLARAVRRLEDHPMPARIDGVTASFLDHLAPELGFGPRLVLANRWLFGPLLELGFARLPPLDAMQRTTTAVTIFEAGVKENALPIRARAIVNFRIHPADSVAAVVEHVRSTVDDDRISLQVGVRSPPREPSAVSPADGPAFQQIAGAIRAVFPEARVVPYLVIGGTDSRFYTPLTANVYRFEPYQLGMEALHLAHGTDEHLSTQNLAQAVRFYTTLLRAAAGPPQPAVPPPSSG